MAKNDNLKDFLTDVADAIREKKGTSEPINPQDFSSEIASIETGGGGTSAMEYWRVPEPFSEGDSEILAFAHLVRTISMDEVVIGGSILGTLEGNTLVAVACDNSLKYMYGGQELSFSDLYSAEAMEGWGFTKISREEFYDTNI